MTTHHSNTNLHTQWQQLITDWQHSNLSQAAFCKAHQLSYHQFVYWRQKLDNSSSNVPSRQSNAFVPVRSESTTALTSDLSLSLPNGLRIHGIGATNLTLVCQWVEHLS